MEARRSLSFRRSSLEPRPWRRGSCLKRDFSDVDSESVSELRAKNLLRTGFHAEGLWTMRGLAAASLQRRGALTQSRGYTRNVYLAVRLRRSLLLLLLLTHGCSRPEPATMRDDLGRSVAVPKSIRRIVTLAPNLTEIVFAIGAGSRVVATDTFSDTPAPARALPKVGGVPPNTERIVAADPDLVLTVSSSGDSALAAALRSANVPLYIVRTDRIVDVARAMEVLAGILDAPGGHASARSLRRAIEAQKRRRVHPPRVLFAIWTDPLFVAGRQTFGDDLLTLAGARNVVQARGWPQYSLESVVADPPDLILYPDKSVTPAAIEALFRTAPELRSRTVAVAVDENRFTRPGPRLVEAAGELNSILDRWEADHASESRP
jgi:iron complex transport system substrate-binding protein